MSTTTSTSSMPQKKHRTTWNALLRNVEPRESPGDLNLEEVLAICGDAEGFLVLSEYAQRTLLTAVLGDTSELVDQVLQSVKMSNTQALTAAEKVMLMVLAPSSISVNDLLPVAAKLLGRHLHDERMICRFVFGDKEPELPATTVCIDGLATEIVAAYSNNMLSMGSSEPCGVPLLGHSSVLLCDLLNKESSTKKFALLMEYSVVTTALPGKNPSADAAVLSVVSNNQPLLLYEYKPVVDVRRLSVNAQHLMELLIQGFYCLRNKGITKLLHCLTDLYAWHYFMLSLNESCQGLIIIEWSKTFVYGSPLQPSVREHYNFLAAYLQSVVTP